MEKFIYDDCFICGKNNPIGLKLGFNYYKVGTKSAAKAEFNLNKDYEGYPGIIHGGIVTGLLDEAMAKVILEHGFKAVTAQINVKFLDKLKPYSDYMVIGFIENIRKKIIKTTAVIKKGDKSIAEAEAVFFIVDDIK